MGVHRIVIALLCAGSVFLAASGVCGGQETYRVAMPLSEVIYHRQQDGQYRGLVADVWREVALRSGLKYHLEGCSNIPECNSKFFSGRLDIVLLGIRPNRENSKTAVFSRPYFISGLRILVIDKLRNHFLMNIRALSAAYSPIVMQSALVFVVFIFIFGNILWFFERKNDTLIARPYGRGLFDAMWCVLEIKTTIGFGDVIPKRHHARLLSVLIWLIGLLLINLITAEIVSEFSTDKVKNTVVGIETLKGKRIAVVNDNISISELKRIAAEVIVKPGLDAVYEGLKSGNADAAVFYAGVVSAYAKRASEDGLPVKVIQGRYDNRYVSIAINRNALLKDPSLLDKINRALDDMYEDGYLSFLKSKWLDK
ncbi:transporter substrate-binding domain-containing protein [Candidatus Magnetominusculus dajiuhuensis]|uniref:transporter substrate-binding domain-containing protein n=1 Tax=Candidatus Magnetominusculus dajiuhuensis TaxID=3137712 RepID=UPI003B438E2A